MSVSAQIQQAIAVLLAQPGALRANVPAVTTRPKELESAIEEAAARSAGLAISIFPVLPTKVIDEAPFVFVEEGDLIVRVMETPNCNTLGVGAWEIAEDIANALHYAPRSGLLSDGVTQNPLTPLLAHPLQLAPTTFQSADFSTPQLRNYRIVDVHFNATYQLPVNETATPGFDTIGDSAALDLQRAIHHRLESAMRSNVPVTVLRDHDQESAIENAGQILFVQIQPPRPARAAQGIPNVVFEGWEAQLKIIENTALNAADVNAYDVLEDVMTTLHWCDFPGLLSYPLQLTPNPTRFDESQELRTIELNLSAVLQFVPPYSGPQDTWDETKTFDSTEVTLDS